MVLGLGGRDWGGGGEVCRSVVGVGWMYVCMSVCWWM